MTRGTVDQRLVLPWTVGTVLRTLTTRLVALRGVDAWIICGLHMARGLPISTQGGLTVPKEESQQHMDTGLGSQ